MDCSLPGSSVSGILQARILDGLPFPAPGDLSDPGIEAGSTPLQADSLPSEGSPQMTKNPIKISLSKKGTVLAHVPGKTTKALVSG